VDALPPGDPSHPLDLGRRYGFAPDPAHPGWLRRAATETGYFADLFDAMAIRLDDDCHVRCRFETSRRHANPLGFLHGGFIMAAVDQSLFMIAAARQAVGPHGAVTLECKTDFISPGQVGAETDVVGEVLRESRRLVFLRGLVEQGGQVIASFSGTMSKISARP
jgi:uncharacterized protein (TIGR00369 family)